MAPLGNLIRLHPLHTSELPEHPALDSLINHPQDEQSSNSPLIRPHIRPFIIHVLNEASQFADDTVLNSFKSRGKKKSPPARHPVELMTKTYSRREISEIPWQNQSLPRQWSGIQDKPAEVWVARKSRHPNRSEEGTATFSEFDEGLRQDHPEHEQDYTPDVYEHYEVLNWSEAIQTEVEKDGQIQGDYAEVRMGSKCLRHPVFVIFRLWPV
ncbi:MAG: hypothetical protein Q9163_004202 [Psora crenata]